MNFKPRHCLECGREFTPDRGNQDCCSRACNKTFNNRRMTRGAELYDWLMAARYDRTRSGKRGLTVLSQIAFDFHEQDKAQRDGRRSWGRLSRSDR